MGLGTATGLYTKEIQIGRQASRSESFDVPLPLPRFRDVARPLYAAPAPTGAARARRRCRLRLRQPGTRRCAVSLGGKSSRDVDVESSSHVVWLLAFVYVARRARH